MWCSSRGVKQAVRCRGLESGGEVQVGSINMAAVCREMGSQASIWMGTLKWGCDRHLTGSSLVLKEKTVLLSLCLSHLNNFL